MSLPGSPSWITVKISPSDEPKSHTPAVRSDGGSVPATLPSPFPDGPWQLAHSCPYARLPAATDSGVAGTGFWSFAASGLPPRRGAVRPSRPDCAVATPSFGATRAGAAQTSTQSSKAKVDL